MDGSSTFPHQIPLRKPLVEKKKPSEEDERMCKEGTATHCCTYVNGPTSPRPKVDAPLWSKTVPNRAERLLHVWNTLSKLRCCANVLGLNQVFWEKRQRVLFWINVNTSLIWKMSINWRHWFQKTFLVLTLRLFLSGRLLINYTKTFASNIKLVSCN